MGPWWPSHFKFPKDVRTNYGCIDLFIPTCQQSWKHCKEILHALFRLGQKKKGFKLLSGLIEVKNSCFQIKQKKYWGIQLDLAHTHQSLSWMWVFHTGYLRHFLEFGMTWEKMSNCWSVYFLNSSKCQSQTELNASFAFVLENQNRSHSNRI